MRLQRLTTRSGEFELFDEGQGPAVLMLHGWPDLALSWRHQIAALAGGGLRAIAPNQRGYGRSFSPEPVEAYSIFDLVGDAVAILDAREIEQAVVVGHDWGALVAWHCALMRPDRFRAVVGMSVPYVPRGDVSVTEALRKLGLTGIYILHFQKEGVDEAALDAEPERALRGAFVGASGDHPAGKGWMPFVLPGHTVLDTIPEVDAPPPWLPADEFAAFVESFRRSGFRSGINWYRNFDRNWALTAPWHGAPIRQPSLFVAGERDGVIRMPGVDVSEDKMRRALPGLRGRHLLDGAGHWIQQERPEAVNALLEGFLKSLA